jgi:YidC/Oxa1 family membrane protein insertase
MLQLLRTIFYLPLFNLLILLTAIIPGNSVGWAIIAMTVSLRLILVPSVNHQIRQQHKLKKLQPELKALQERHKEDRETLARETMTLYKKYDIHPLGSCLPMLIQLPILIPLFYVFRDGLSTAHFDQLYSFIPQPEVLNTIFFGIDLAKPDKFILPILVAVLQFVQSWMLIKSPAAHQPENDTQKMLNTQMVYFFPLITGFISLSLPAALPLYYGVGSLFAIIQQYFVLKTIPKPDRIAEVPGAVSAVPDETSAQRGQVRVTVRSKGK